MSVAAPMIACLMWKLRQETIRLQQRNQTNMVEIGPMALATWGSWIGLDTVPLLRLQTLFPMTNGLTRMLRDETIQLIGACAMYQRAYLEVPFPSDMNAMDAYAQFMAEIERFPVLFERQLERICRDYQPTLARMMQAAIEMFNTLGHALGGDRWLLKVADSLAEATVRCRLYHGNSPSLLDINPAHLPPGADRDRAIAIAHPVHEEVREDGSTCSWSFGDDPTPEDP